MAQPETYDAIEITFPIHSQEEEEALEELRSRLIQEFHREQKREMVYVKKQGERPEMEATIVCYLDDAGQSWKQVRRILIEEGVIDKTTFLEDRS